MDPGHHNREPMSYREIALGIIAVVLMVIVLPYLFQYGPTLFYELTSP